MTNRASHALVRTDFGGIPRYAPDPWVEYNLGENTNLWGSPPAVIDALRAASLDGAANYPDMYADPLKRTVAALAGVGEDCVVTGNSSGEILDRAIRAFASPGDRLAHPDPTFVMLPVFARLNSLIPVSVPLTTDHRNDCDALLRTGARIIYLCSPNNPVPVATRADAIRRAIANAPGIVILDEAYADFSSEPSLLSEAPSLERVIVCRTLSKAYGLAGLRVGYATAAPALVEAIEKSRGPFTVNSLAQRAAIAALTDGRDWVVARTAESISNRDRFASALASIGFASLPSDANFLLVPTTRAFAIAARLRKRGIGVRPFRNVPGIGDALRITSAPWPLLERVLIAMRD